MVKKSRGLKIRASSRRVARRASGVAKIRHPRASIKGEMMEGWLLTLMSDFEKGRWSWAKNFMEPSSVLISRGRTRGTRGRDAPGQLSRLASEVLHSCSPAVLNCSPAPRPRAETSAGAPRGPPGPVILVERYWTPATDFTARARVSSFP